MPAVIIVGGPAGTGKTTIATILAKHYQCPFVEGDLLHPPANIKKMAEGQPLTDEDRWGWLQSLSEITSEKAKESNFAVASCSILKKVYRDHIEKHGANVTFRFVFLHTTYEELLNRVEKRQGHYMKLEMVKSQFDIMEVPEGSELLANGGHSLEVDTSDRSPEQISQQILASLSAQNIEMSQK